MKIAMTHVDLPNEAKGGVAFQVHYLANALVERGHDVTIFTFSPHYSECRYQVHQYPISPRLRRYKSFLLALCSARTDFSGFDVLHAHGDNYLLRGRHPQVRTFYGSAKDEAQSATSWKRRIYQTFMVVLESIGGRVADKSIGISKSTQDRIAIISDIIPCGVDLQEFRPGPKSKTPAILFVGTTGGRKRGKMLADIFLQEILPVFPEAQLWSVAEKSLEGENVVNFGKVSLETLTDLYRQAWVFCLPSTYEGFGVPYIEAMASGTSVVAAPNPGAREVLDEGKYGLLPNDDQIGTQILALLSDAGQRSKYEGLGLGRAAEYDWQNIAGQYEQVYRHLLDPKGAKDCHAA